jgi:hypothetical protein
VQAAEKKQLLSLLDELGGAVEELLLAGLTTASKSTVERLDVTFKEASRMRLLRLGGTLRIANEEISRFTSGSQQFSARRLAFFLGRAWLLAGAMRSALDANDDAAFVRVATVPSSTPVERISVVTLGVSKRVVPGAFSAFDFRLRAVEDSGPLKRGDRIIWSCVRPSPKDKELPAEASLHLREKDPFVPAVLLQRKVVEIARCGVTMQVGGPARLALSDNTEAVAGAVFTEWKDFWHWQPGDAVQRLESYRPTPLDLEVELQEEVFFEAWAQAGERTALDEGYELLPIVAQQLSLAARIDRPPSGAPLNEKLTKLAAAKKKRPLFGIVHYESCQLLFQPLTALVDDGVDYLTISLDKVSKAELAKSLKYT